jgi:hypothetical protein
MEEQNPVTEKANKFPKWLTTVTPLSKALAMILFIALPFLGFYLGIQYQQKITVATPVVSEVQKIPTPTPTVTQTDTSNWKTYTGATFTLKYPTEFSAITTGTTLNIKDLTGAFNLAINNEPTNLDLNTYVDQKSLCTSIKSTSGKQYQINLENSLRFDKTPCGQVGSTDIYTVHKGTAYHFSIATQANYDSFVPTLNQMLSTFKFLQ